MVRCVHLEVFLSDYADGIADARTRRIVERHVQLCARCRHRVQRAHQVSQEVRRLALLPPGVSSRVARFRHRLEARPASGPRLEHYPYYVSVLLMTLLVLMTLLTLLSLGV